MTRRLSVIVATVVLVGCTSSPGESDAAAPSATPLASVAATSTPETSEPPSPSAAAPSEEPAEPTYEMVTFDVPAGSQPHDVAPAADGGVWYSGQGNGTLGWLDPENGEVREIPLGPGSAPHGVITGPDDAAWLTDGGLNAIVRVDAATSEITVYPLDVPDANLNTATFDGDGILWFTGQNGWYGRLDPSTGALETFGAPRGTGPYGIATTPEGEVAYSSLAGSYLGLIDRASGEVRVVDTPTPGGGARRVWSDSSGRLWVTEWFAGKLAAYDPGSEEWTEWPLPGNAPEPYAVYVDETDAVWVTDFGGNALHRFDPATESWTTFEHTSSPANVRQLLGRPGEVWGAESAADRLMVVRWTSP
jgi:virginiamycin B lyase